MSIWQEGVGIDKLGDLDWVGSNFSSIMCMHAKYFTPGCFVIVFFGHKNCTSVSLKGVYSLYCESLLTSSTLLLLLLTPSVGRMWPKLGYNRSGFPQTCPPFRPLSGRTGEFSLMWFLSGFHENASTSLKMGIRILGVRC